MITVCIILIRNYYFIIWSIKHHASKLWVPTFPLCCWTKSNTIIRGVYSSNNSFSFITIWRIIISNYNFIITAIKCNCMIMWYYTLIYLRCSKTNTCSRNSSNHHCTILTISIIPIYNYYSIWITVKSNSHNIWCTTFKYNCWSKRRGWTRCLYIISSYTICCLYCGYCTICNIIFCKTYEVFWGEVFWGKGVA